LEKCTSQITHSTLGTSDRAKLKEKELTFSLMELTTMEISKIIALHHLTVNLYPKLSSITEASITMLSTDKVVSKAETTNSKELSTKEFDSKAHLNGITVQICIQDHSTKITSFMEKVMDVLFRGFNRT
jgi:hypothetical protein